MEASGRSQGKKSKFSFVSTFPKHSRLLIPPLFPAGALASSHWFLPDTLARGPGAGHASSQESRAGYAATGETGDATWCSQDLLIL